MNGLGSGLKGETKSAEGLRECVHTPTVCEKIKSATGAQGGDWGLKLDGVLFALQCFNPFFGSFLFF